MLLRGGMRWDREWKELRGGMSLRHHMDCSGSGQREQKQWEHEWEREWKLEKIGRCHSNGSQSRVREGARCGSSVSA
jgi:hypothetical protein